MNSVNRLRPSAEIFRQTNLSQEIATREQQIATGKRLTRASQDPVSWSRLSAISQTQSDTAAWLRNIDRASAVAAHAEANISEISDNLARLNELLVQGSSDTLSTANRETIAAEVEIIGLTINSLTGVDNIYGQALFPNTQALEVPIGPNRRVTTSPTQADIGDMNSVITEIAAAIRSADPMQRSAAFDTLGQKIDANAVLLAGQGQATRAMEDSRANLENQNLNLSAEQSELADTDLTIAISEVRTFLVNLEAAQATFARINQTSLFDLIG